MKIFMTLAFALTVYFFYAISQLSDRVDQTVAKSRAVKSEYATKPYNNELSIKQHVEMVNVDQKDLLCLQKNIFFEARNQSKLAQIAVAWVTFNRVNHPKHKNTICDVVYRGVHKNGIPVKNRCAFSWYCDRKPDKPKNNKIELMAWEQAGDIAEYMIKNCLIQKNSSCPKDPTNGALFYFNPDLADPHWKNVKVKTASIDNHVFYTYAD